MKKWFLILALAMVSVAAHAQFISTVPEGALKRKGGVMKTLDKENPVKLSPEQVAYVLSDIDGVDYNEEWQALDKKRKTGVGLIVGGSIAAGTGAVFFLGTTIVHVLVLILGAPITAIADDSGEATKKMEEDLRKQFAPWYIGSGIVAGAGTVCAIAGIPTTVSNCKKMNAIVDRYNESHAPAASLPEVTLKFGRTSNGIGFALNF